MQDPGMSFDKGVKPLAHFGTWRPLHNPDVVFI
jgi:hypothetical protein